MNYGTRIGIALWSLIPGFIAKNKGRSFWGYYFLSFLITPLVTMIITICLKKITPIRTNSSDVFSPNKVSSLSIDSKSGPQNLEDVQPQIDADVQATVKKLEVMEQQQDEFIEPKKIKFCRRCGFELIRDSEFCSYCGSQIEKVTSI